MKDASEPIPYLTVLHPINFCGGVAHRPFDRVRGREQHREGLRQSQLRRRERRKRRLEG